MSKGRARGTPSQRQLRVNELVRKALAEIFARTDIADADLAGASVTVTEVRISPDLRHATVYVVPLGGARQERVVAALNRNQRFLRGELARKVTLKFMPDLAFELDRSFDASDRMNALLSSGRVARDLGRG